MTTRLRTPASLWLQRARAFALALGGPSLWIVLLALAHGRAAHACDLLARFRLLALVSLGMSACGLAALLGQRRLRLYALRDPEARYLLLASGTLHLMCALSLVAQIIPIVFGVTCHP